MVEEKDLHGWLKDWFKAYHLHMMPSNIRARWEKLRGKQDESDIVTAETQQNYRDFIANVGDEVEITIDKENKADVNRIFGGNWSEDEKIKVRITTREIQREYFEHINVSTKIGNRVYMNDLRSGGQKGWGDEKTGQLLDMVPEISKKPNEEPLLPTMKVSEQRRFYAITRDALRKIKDTPPEFFNPDAPALVSAFLGKGKAFEEFDAPENVKKELTTLGEFLGSEEASNFRVWLTSAQSGTGYKIFSEKPTLDEFIDALKSGKYDSSKGIPTKISEFLNQICEWLNPSYGKSAIERFGNIKKKFEKLFGTTGEKASKMITDMDPANEKIDDIKFATFINAGVYSNLLKALYDPTKPDRQSKFFKDFEKAGGVAITTPMGLVVDNFKYDGMVEKYDDDKTVFQKMDKTIGEWFENHITKLWKRNLRHQYLEPVAKGVVDAICKSEINPTDGLKAILDKKDAIKKKIPDSGQNGFDFLVEILGKINDSGEMKSAFAGALKNGKQCEAIAKEIIKYGVAKNRVGDTKIALETLAVMRYDIFSSANWESWKKVTPDLFKGVKGFDKGFLKWVGSAVNWTVNTGVNALFWGAVVARNKFQFGRAKMSNSRVREIQESMAKIQENSTPNAFDTLDSTRDLLAQTEAELVTAQQTLANFETKHRSELEEKKNIQNLEVEINNLKDVLDHDQKRRDTKAHYVNDFKAFMDGKQTNISPKNLKKFETWSANNPQKTNDQETILENYLKYLEEIPVMNDNIRAVNIALKDVKEHTLEQKRARIEALNEKWIEHEQLHNQVIVATALRNNAQDRFKNQKKKQGDRLEKDTPGAPAKNPTSEMQDVMELTMFWNAANGYIPDINVNDRSLRKHKNKSVKPDFLRYAQRQHMERAA